MAFCSWFQRHSPLIVRTDTVNSLQDVLKEKYGMPLAGPIETIEREVDVSHFWPSDGVGVGQVESALRHRVSAIIQKMGEKDNIKVYVGLAGDAARTGRRGVKSAYIEGLLNTKIVIVTQRDRWEDHYRLFEALATGPLVITDRMLSLPQGLQNGTSVIECTSAEDLRSKILYYLAHPKERLAIAKRGRSVAMTRHRTWHRIEEIIFGSPLTKCSENAGSPCPYIVHANESGRRRRRRR
jgi:glycosyltransferase involved in cell wall biosynthesis